MELARAETPTHFEQARALFEEYVAGLGLDLEFQHLDEEMRSLERMYGPPDGSLLLALDAGEAAGCVAVRALPAVAGNACEMKRLYVRPPYRGRGLGRRLAEAAVGEGRRLGYGRMFLDTLASMQRARALYQALGFREVPPYYPNPLADLRFLALDLTRPAGATP